MAFDWKNVEGYREDMTAEEKLALLDNMPDLPKPEDKPEEQPAPVGTPKGFISKKQFDEVSSQLAKAKRELRSKMTEDEQREADRQAQYEAMTAELEGLKKEKTLSTYKASFLAQGYDADLADQAATAMADGDMETVFLVMGKQNKIYEKALRTKLLAETPIPPAGDGNPDKVKEKQEENKRRAAFGLPPLP